MTQPATKQEVAGIVLATNQKNVERWPTPEDKMNNQASRAEQFRKLHVPGKPLVLFNVWDAGSAKVIAKAGVKAVGTSSWSVAAANGFADGEQLPLDVAIDNLRRIVRAIDLPVTIDLESGYGDAPESVAKTVASAIDAGAIGCNLEDSYPANGQLRDIREHCERIRRARQAADASTVRFFINARTDVFFLPSAQPHTEEMVAQAIERARAYADAGADGLFAPGLVDSRLIAKLAAASPLPLNVMVGGKTPPLATLAENGVARVSHGPGPYFAAMNALEAAARAAGITE